MPIYEYIATDPSKRSCDYCREGFETTQHINDPRLVKCPECGAPIRRRITSPAAIGRSQSSLDDRAKAAGFTKLKRLGKGEYEKQY